MLTVLWLESRFQHALGLIFCPSHHQLLMSTALVWQSQMISGHHGPYMASHTLILHSSRTRQKGFSCPCLPTLATTLRRADEAVPSHHIKCSIQICTRLWPVKYISCITQILPWMFFAGAAAAVPMHSRPSKPAVASHYDLVIKSG